MSAPHRRPGHFGWSAKFIVCSVEWYASILNSYGSYTHKYSQISESVRGAAATRIFSIITAPATAAVAPDNGTTNQILLLFTHMIFVCNVLHTHTVTQTIMAHGPKLINRKPGRSSIATSNDYTADSQWRLWYQCIGIALISGNARVLVINHINYHTIPYKCLWFPIINY